MEIINLVRRVATPPGAAIALGSKRRRDKDRELLLANMGWDLEDKPMPARMCTRARPYHF
ncbi:hypothetical protein HaLaN_28225 [Haematococcus lacustris]|uniref:Uncharacterized protein n=1 Tax=Haematococcus lacustris TaxID=44745 RepID=A0A6A0AA21_HAELA|nr:hypothetical protein HaLaN_28225 [Haematococcus lacustris]